LCPCSDIQAKNELNAFLYSIQLATNNEWYIVHVSCMAKKIKLTTRLEIDKTFPFVGNLGRLVT